MGGSGVVAFLVGVGWFHEGGFTVEQLFMQDYDRETDMHTKLCRQMENFRYLVTFNGKSFDAPLLESRMVMSRIRSPISKLEPVDLLHGARRLWKNRLESCSLGSLEAAILSLAREGDIPGSQIPEVYFRYLAGEGFSEIERVLEHNRQDIFSMALLLERMTRIYRDPSGDADVALVRIVGVELLRQGDVEGAERCFQEVLCDKEAIRQLSFIYKRRKDYPRALELWLAMREKGGFGTLPYVEAAKYYEHAAKDHAKALEWVDACLLRMDSFSMLSHPEKPALMQRRQRLLQKLQRKEVFT